MVPGLDVATLGFDEPAFGPHYLSVRFPARAAASSARAFSGSPTAA